MPGRTRTWWPPVAACVLLLLFVGQGLAFIARNSQTADEAAHLVVGYSYWVHGHERLNPDYPPFLRAFLALPVYLQYELPLEQFPRSHRDDIWRIGRDFLYTTSISGDRILSLARVSNLFLGAALIGLVGWWGYRLWGRGAGLLAMALAALEPNLVAHSSVVTTDVGVTLFIFLSVYLLWEYTARPSGWLLFALGASTGLALASKHLAILLLGMLAVLLAGEALFGSTTPLPRLGRRTYAKPLRWRLAAAGLALWVILLTAAVVVDVVHIGRGLDDWWEGFQAIRKANTHGFPSYFYGQYSRDGWWDYFLVAFVIKTPVGSLALIAAALLAAAAGETLTRRQAAYLLLPVVVWLIATSFGAINVGLRHVLPVYPFLFVVAGSLATVRLSKHWLIPVLVGLPLLGTAVSALRLAPHPIAYFNELVGGPEKGHKYLSDSNLDWGQDLKGLKTYLDREGVSMVYLAHYNVAPPAVYGIRYQYLPAFGPLGPPPLATLPSGEGRELLAISAGNLLGVHFADKDRYWWLNERRLVAKIGYSIFVYDLTGDAEAHFRLALIYLREHLPTLAEHEFRKVLALDPGNVRARQYLDGQQTKEGRK
jgi:4-amino-4-deoxy-L-arabinose transferase-like glycosyltransferase